MMKILSTVFYWFLILVALIQFIPVDRTNRPVKGKENFVEIKQTPQNVREVLKKACYDCHSNETRYPDYAFVAPFSWAVKNHVNKGRKHLNFSVWGTLNDDLKKNMLENSVRTVKDYSMPVPAYIAQHAEANLTKAERTLLERYFTEILQSKRY